jgi:hypothetical protein
LIVEFPREARARSIYSWKFARDGKLSASKLS